MALGPLPPRTGPYRVLAVSGSLRGASSNTLALQAAAALAPERLLVELYAGLRELPPFNPDHDEDQIRPAPVRLWRAMIAAADALLISSPEYAHGVPGALKNALDWLVSGPEFPAIFVAFVNPSPRATYAQAALAETVATMSARIVTEACLTLPLAGRTLSQDDILGDPSLAMPLHHAMAALARAIARGREENRRLVPARSEAAL